MSASGFFIRNKKFNKTGNINSIRPIIKKRSNYDRENEVSIMKLSPSDVSSIPNSYGDRFIARRYTNNVNQNSQNIYLSKFERHQSKENYIDFFESRLNNGYWRLNSFKIHYNTLTNINEKTFQYSDPIVQNKTQKLLKVLPSTKSYCTTSIKSNRFDWPCKPRSRPLAVEETTHRLTLSCLTEGEQIIAWSSKGTLAAAFDFQLVFWDPFSDSSLCYRMSDITAMAFSPSSDYLAIGSFIKGKPVLEIFEIDEFNKHLFASYEPSLEKYNIITCIRWDNYGFTVACGYENGRIEIYNLPKLQLIKIIKHHDSAIYSIKYSKNLKYLATLDVNGEMNIFLGCKYQHLYKFESTLSIDIEWHPWDENELIFVEPFPASINVFHVPSKEIIAYYKRKDTKLEIDSLTINKLTGEIFIGCTVHKENSNNQTETTYEIFVLSSLEHIVDILENHINKIKLMLWSPNNLQLAAIDNYDIIKIWNVFGTNDDKTINKFNKININSNLNNNSSTMLNNFRCIR